CPPATGAPAEPPAAPSTPPAAPSGSAPSSPSDYGSSAPATGGGAASTGAGSAIHPGRDQQDLLAQGSHRPQAGEMASSPQEIFSDDWWGKARPVIDMHGYFRTRAELF